MYLLYIPNSRDREISHYTFLKALHDISISADPFSCFFRHKSPRRKQIPTTPISCRAAVAKKELKCHFLSRFACTNFWESPVFVSLVLCRYQEQQSFGRVQYSEGGNNNKLSPVKYQNSKEIVADHPQC